MKFQFFLYIIEDLITLIFLSHLKYTPSNLVKGGFNWGLHFKWDNIPMSQFADKQNYARPIP